MLQWLSNASMLRGINVDKKRTPQPTLPSSSSMLNILGTAEKFDDLLYQHLQAFKEMIELHIFNYQYETT